MMVNTSPAESARELQPACIVTGASSGIGRELASQASRDCKAIVLVARTEAPMQALAEEIRCNGRTVVVLPLDISRQDAGERIDACLQANGLYCDILINNAGYGLLGNAATLDRASQVGIVDLNIRALTELSLRYLPGMIARGRGGILNVASVAGFLPGPGMAVYYASKAYVLSFSQALWEESRRSGVTVSCLCPGPVETSFFDRAGANTARLFQSGIKMDARTCAAIGWSGFLKGRRVVVTGAINRLVTTFAPILPTRLVLHAVRRMQKNRQGPV